MSTRSDALAPVTPELTLHDPEAAAWLYGALLQRRALHGLPREGEARREVDALREALADALPTDLVDREVTRATDLEWMVRRAA